MVKNHPVYATSDEEQVNSETVEAFLEEGLIMKDFSHRNVLTLLGVAIGQGGLPMIVLPFMQHGNLKTYISNPTLMVGDEFVDVPLTLNAYTSRSRSGSSWSSANRLQRECSICRNINLCIVIWLCGTACEHHIVRCACLCFICL